MKYHRYRAREVDRVFRRVGIAVIGMAFGILAYITYPEDPAVFGACAAPIQVVPSTDTGPLK